MWVLCVSPLSLHSTPPIQSPFQTVAVTVMGNTAAGRPDDEESPLVGAGRRGAAGSPLSNARAAWFSEAGAGDNSAPGAAAGPQHAAQSYGAFVKSTAGADNHAHGMGSMGMAASSGRGAGSHMSGSGLTSASRVQLLRDQWPVLTEFLAAFVLAFAALASRSNPWSLGLVLAGLAHAASTGAYYLQANPALTLAQLLRGYLTLKRAALFWAAQLLGLLLAVVLYSVSGPSHSNGTSGSGSVLSAVEPLVPCAAQPRGPALLLLALFSSAWVYTALGAWDSMALALEASCTFYGMAQGAAFAAAAASIQARGVGSALLNPWVGLLALVDVAVGGGGGKGSVGCAVLFIVGPVLGALLGALLSWLTSLNGSEKEAFLRSISPIAPLLVETVGVTFLVTTLGASGHGFITGAMALGLTLCAWRRSGAQFNVGVTLTVFLLKRHMFRWASLLFYLLAHLAGALIGSCLLILLPLAREPGAGGSAPVSVLQQAVAMDGRAALLLLVLSTAFLCTFVGNTDAEYDEGFLHPAMMVGVTYTGLLAAYGDAGALQTGLFNPAVTLVLWSISRASMAVVLLGTLIQLAASALTFGFFWSKNQLDI